MGSSLGPVIANIFMTELEKFILDELINDNIVKFYIRYVDDTLLLIKTEDTDKILKKFNSFDKNIQFTVDKFLNGNVHFLDIKINRNKTDIYFKEAHTGQYTHFTSNTLWRFKTAWTRSLYHRVKKIVVITFYLRTKFK